MVNVDSKNNILYKKTGFLEFNSDIGVTGLFKVNFKSNSLHILAVISERKGAFREFISKAKEEFSAIYFYEVWNSIIEDALKRYGFTNRTWADSGSILNGFMWTKNPDITGPVITRLDHGNDCPGCGKKLDAVSCPDNPERLPSSGDITVCMHCATVLMFDEKLRTVLCPPELED